MKYFTTKRVGLQYFFRNQKYITQNKALCSFLQIYLIKYHEAFTILNSPTVRQTLLKINGITKRLER